MHLSREKENYYCSRQTWLLHDGTFLSKLQRTVEEQYCNIWFRIYESHIFVVQYVVPEVAAKKNSRMDWTRHILNKQRIIL